MCNRHPLLILAVVLSFPVKTSLLPIQRSDELTSFRYAIREAEIEWHSADPCDVQEHLQGRYDFSLRSVAVSTSLVFQKDVDRQSVARSVWNSDQASGSNVISVLWKHNEIVLVYGVSPSDSIESGDFVFTDNCLMCYTAQISSMVYFGAGLQGLVSQKSGLCFAPIDRAFHLDQQRV